MPRHRSNLYRSLLLFQMRNRALDRPRPDKADVAVSGLHGQSRHGICLKARSMAIQLHVTKTIRVTLTALDHTHSEHARVEIVRARPIGDVDDAVIEFDGCLYSHFGLSRALGGPSPAPNGVFSRFRVCHACAVLWR